MTRRLAVNRIWARLRKQIGAYAPSCFLAVLVVLAFPLCSTWPTYAASARSVSLIYTPKDVMIAQWKGLCDAHPAWASYESIGKSIQGRDIWLFKIGNPSGGRVMYDGECHGPEDTGTESLYKYCKWLLESNDPLANHILQWNYHLIIPILNIDTTNRTNMRRRYTLSNGTIIAVPYGVDLNRNAIYGWGLTGSGNPQSPDSYRGLYAGSEPETMAYRNAAAKYKPAIYCNTHTGGTERLFYCSNTPLETKIISLITQYDAQYKITNPYPFCQSGASGYIYADVDNLLGASGWMWEMCTWANLKPTLNEWLAAYYPKILPVFLAFAKAVEKEPPLLQSNASAIFRDDFEKGLTTWTQSTTQIGLAPVTQNGTYRSGNYAAKFYTGATLAFATSMVSKSISPINELYIRAYYYIEMPKLLSLGANDRFYILRLTAGNDGVASLGLRREGTMPARWCIWRATNGVEGTHIYGQTENATNVPKWTCIEFMWDKTTSSIKVWINGNLEFENRGNWTNVPDVDGFSIGIYKSAATELLYDPTTAFTSLVFVDDAIAGKQYIGP